MRKGQRSTRTEPITALINIVFLILIFFMVAGTLSKPPDPSLEFIETTDLECCVPPDALSISMSGEMWLQGEQIQSLDQYLSMLSDGEHTARIVPDHRLPAQTLLKIVKSLQEAGVQKIVIITESQME